MDEEPPSVDPATLRESLGKDLRDRLAAAVRLVMEKPEAELFVQPVDIDNYHIFVPVPMDLGLILRRLEKVGIDFLFCLWLFRLWC